MAPINTNLLSENLSVTWLPPSCLLAVFAPLATITF